MSYNGYLNGAAAAAAVANVIISNKGKNKMKGHNIIGGAQYNQND